MRLYDTMSRTVRTVETAHPQFARIYACGPTVYRDAHVGNMRTFLVTDLITRSLQYQGIRTQVVQNITDVGHMANDTGLGDNLDINPDDGQAGTEDKVLAEATSSGVTALEIAAHYELAFHRDLASLNIYPADSYPKASESIDSMITLIEQLIASGHAYVGTDATVYFDAQSFPSYGALSGNKLDQLKPGHRFDLDDTDNAKRFHADWALWKVAGSERTQLTWETPWGRGFPGWHTECSAMSLQLLGDTIDIHTGGIDLRFPHHEDERAQSNSAAGREVVGHWVHAEHLLFENRKMSKSSGNVVLVSDVMDRGYDPLALRLAFLQHRYRSQMNLTWDVIASANDQLQKWRTKVNEWSTSPSAPMAQEYLDRFTNLFFDDLNTPLAINELRALERDADVADGAKCETFIHLDRLLGLDLARDIGKSTSVPPEIADLLSEREQARAAKDWAASDRLRDQIAELGFTVQDTAQGQEVTSTH
ncbi:MAG: cysteine--tRNA ligase [Candidatus Nanopelagicales bacterium]|nr:cysteine--tRNA ligase [Candidatus Nanopelagicales bacterium]MCF8538854.1 cysteine--tRNA ligase [Candidatus Nanopelagicales bacterium]